MPNESQHICEAFKVQQNAEGFYLEAHMKLRPVDFATEGMFLAGLAHYPKPIDESITQAKAARPGLPPSWPRMSSWSAALWLWWNPKNAPFA